VLKSRSRPCVAFIYVTWEGAQTCTAAKQAPHQTWQPFAQVLCMCALLHNIQRCIHPYLFQHWFRLQQSPLQGCKSFILCHTQTHTHTHSHTHTHTCTHTHAQTHTRTHTHTCTHTCTDTHTYTHIHTRVLRVAFLPCCLLFLNTLNDSKLRAGAVGHGGHYHRYFLCHFYVCNVLFVIRLCSPCNHHLHAIEDDCNLIE